MFIVLSILFILLFIHNSHFSLFYCYLYFSIKSIKHEIIDIKTLKKNQNNILYYYIIIICIELNYFRHDRLLFTLIFILLYTLNAFLNIYIIIVNIPCFIFIFSDRCIFIYFTVRKCFFFFDKNFFSRGIFKMFLQFYAFNIFSFIINFIQFF